MVERSIEYVQSVSNFDSIYNAPLSVNPQAPTYEPLTAWGTYFPVPYRPSSPLFRRAISPPPRRPILPEPGPKFNFDLYKPDESILDCNGYTSPSHRPLSPTSSSIVHHCGLFSPLSSPIPQTRSLSKLREINDELYQTLARAEFDGPASAAPHYHIHHYPVSELSRQTYHRRSSYDQYSSPTNVEVSPKIHKARVTYRVHFPKQHRSPPRRTSRHASPSSDTASSEEPIVIDLYPTGDEKFVKRSHRHAGHQSPWIVEGTSLRRGSYSDASTPRSPRTPKVLYYGDKPIKSYRRSSREKERPSSRNHERVWHPPSRTTSDKPPKYFQPIVKPERDMSARVRSAIDETESEPLSQRKTVSHRTDIRTSDPKLKRRVAHAESKVKSAWEPTVTGLTSSTAKGSKPSTPQPVKQTTIVTPPKSHNKSALSEPTTPVKKAESAPPQPSTTASTGRSSVNDIPVKPIFESTPRDQSMAEKNNESVEDLFENEFHISEPTDRKDVPHSSPTEPPKPPVREPEKETNSTIKDNPSATAKNDHAEPLPATSDAAKTHDTQPTPPPEVPNPVRKTPSPKPDQKNDESVLTGDDGDENDQEVARSFDFDEYIARQSELISAGEKQNAVIAPQPPPPPRAPKVKTPPRRKVQPPSPPAETSDENLYKPPFGPKRADRKPAAASPPPSAGVTVEVDDFFS